MIEMNRAPNLFDYATSELSQDAFLCWLISWASEQYSAVDKNLHYLASCLTKELLKAPSSYEISKVEVNKQWNNIDIVVWVDNKYMLVIEDKKFTSEGNNQLERYRDIATAFNSSHNYEIECVYFKMIEQGSYTKIETSGFRQFDRKSMLRLLEQYIESTPITQHNNIVVDFYQNLLSLEKKVSAFCSLKTEHWDWYCWIGFYSKLKKVIKPVGWRHIPNKAGGFLGFYWHFKAFQYNKVQCEAYLQLEQHKLVIKLLVPEPHLRREVKNYFQRILLATAQQRNIDLVKFGRVGKSMSAAKFDGGYLQTDSSDILCFEETVSTLRAVEDLLEEVVSSISG